jgi:hypothetical protein
MIWYRVSVSVYVKEIDDNDAHGVVVQKLEQAGFDEFEIDFVDIAGSRFQVLDQ